MRTIDVILPNGYTACYLENGRFYCVKDLNGKPTMVQMNVKGAFVECESDAGIGGVGIGGLPIRGAYVNIMDCNIAIPHHLFVPMEDVHKKI